MYYTNPKASLMGTRCICTLFVISGILSAADCTFVPDRDQFLARQARARQEIADRVWKLNRAVAAGSSRNLLAAAIPQRNFIDAEIFGEIARARIPVAPLTTDQEFFRRIHLDLIGRLPSAQELGEFLADSSPAKRDDVIDRLLYSPEFVDRWTMWMGDLLQNNYFATNFSRQLAGRNAFYDWIKESVANRKSLKDIAWEAVIATGNNYTPEAGPANFMLGGITPNGPIQDTYDTMLSRTASTFLGIAYYDCLLCHNGRGHLDQISLWAANTTRAEAQQMAAFFSRTRWTRDAAVQGEPMFNSYFVWNAPAGQYDLTTNFGNRPTRAAIGTMRNLTPQYRTGATPSNGEWRDAFAANMVSDPMFARNLANRLWKQLFGLGLVDPVDTMDPARLDPANPPPAPWTLQATHPQLLDRLAWELSQRNFDLREFLRLLVESSAYQLSSRYEGEWNVSYVPLFARHYPRRLQSEEIADAIVKASGVPGRFTATGSSELLDWAMQLPDTTGGGPATNLMNSLLRGNRDTQQRSQSSSILQQLNMMNDVFVLDRVRLSASPVLQEISKLPDNESILDRIFLRFLSRPPTAYERERGLAFLQKATTPAARNAAVEDLAWVCINKVEFLFSY